MKTYRVSALASALVRMWRAWAVIVPVIIVNAVVQGLLVAWDPSSGAWWEPAVLAVPSAVAFVFAYGLIASAALRVPYERVGPVAAWRGLRAHLLPYLVWALILLIVVSAGLAIHLLVAVLLVGLTAFVLLAVLDGRPRPLLVNFQTLGRRIWRWLATGVVVFVVVLTAVLLMGVTQFFLRDFLGAAVAWLGAGLVIAWFIVVRALLYVSAWAEDVEEEGAAVLEEPTPDLA